MLHSIPVLVNEMPDIVCNKVFTHIVSGFVNYVVTYFIYKCKVSVFYTIVMFVYITCDCLSCLHIF